MGIYLIGAVCADCTLTVANADQSGMRDEDIPRVNAALDRAATLADGSAGQLVVTSREDGDGYGFGRCECCNGLPGDRPAMLYVIDDTSGDTMPSCPVCGDPIDYCQGGHDQDDDGRLYVSEERARELYAWEHVGTQWQGIDPTPEELERFCFCEDLAIR